jgi:hypothetical protein
LGRARAGATCSDRDAPACNNAGKVPSECVERKYIRDVWKSRSQRNSAMAGAPELSHSVVSPRETRHESKLSEDQTIRCGWIPHRRDPPDLVTVNTSNNSNRNHRIRLFPIEHARTIAQRSAYEPNCHAPPCSACAGYQVVVREPYRVLLASQACRSDSMNRRYSCSLRSGTSS